jgi:hypothetical protein
MAKTASMATALLMSGGVPAAQAFSVVGSHKGSASSPNSLRHRSTATTESSVWPDCMSLAMGTASAAAAMSMVSASRKSAGNRTHKKQITRLAAAVEPAVEAEEPPPPPPFDPSKQLGATDPLGFFDPLGFCKVGDEEGFRKFRIAEIKHGRVAMMAAVGAVFQHFVKFPGFEKVPAGLGAVTSAPGTYGFVALFLVSGLFELVLWKDDPAKEIGDYGNPLQLGIGDPLGESMDMRNRELNNGRAAMFAIMGIIVAELATGKDAWEQLM